MTKKKKILKEISKEPSVGLITIVDPASPVSEQYRTLRTNIQFASSADNKVKTIVVTSSSPNEGKSTIASNLAIVFAQAGQSVLLVDADMRKSTVHHSFSLRNDIGLSPLLSTNRETNSCIQKSDVQNLFIITSGPKPPNPSELLGSNRMESVLKEFRNQYDIVIFDMPPITMVTDAQLVAAKTDGTIIVARENVTRKDYLLQAEKMLKMVGANILGIVYNGMNVNKDHGYYYYYED